MRKMRLLVDELEKLRENNQRLLIENDLLRSKYRKIEQQVTERMLNEEIIRLDAQICEITGDECYRSGNCEKCSEMENWPWK